MWASDGLAEEASAPVAPDGSFQLPSLHPGGWQLRAFEPGRRHYTEGGRMVTEREPVFDVEVFEGRTTAYEHRSRARAAARLAGRLTIDGTPPGPGLVIVRTSTAHGAIASHEATLDPDGRFELTLEPGLGTNVSVQLARDGVQWTVNSKPVIVPGLNEWHAELASARLEGTLVPVCGADEFPGNGPTYTVERWDLRVSALWRPGEDGRFGPLSVPAGRGTLRGPSPGMLSRGEVLAELELTAGETRSVAFPAR
jgi:hypothetical protein